MFPRRKENLPAPPPDLAVMELPFPASLAADGIRSFHEAPEHVLKQAPVPTRGFDFQWYCWASY